MNLSEFFRAAITAIWITPHPLTLSTLHIFQSLTGVLITYKTKCSANPENLSAYRDIPREFHVDNCDCQGVGSRSVLDI
jgi:hypothetical protein